MNKVLFFELSVIFFSLFLFSCNKVDNSNYELIFNYKVLVCDTVNEDIGTVDFDFIYHNISHSPLYIVATDSPCACTEAFFSEEALSPGDSAVIHVTYETIARPGEIDKPVFVTYYCNDSTKVGTIYIRGYVVPNNRFATVH